MGASRNLKTQMKWKEESMFFLISFCFQGSLQEGGTEEREDVIIPLKEGREDAEASWKDKELLVSQRPSNLLKSPSLY